PVVAQFVKGWNAGDYEAVGAVTPADFVRHVGDVRTSSNRDELIGEMQAFRTGFPDMNVSINNVVSTADKAFVNWTFTGTHDGPFQDIEPTGKSVEVSGLTVVFVGEDGQFVREDVYFDQLSFMQQLGFEVAPVDGA
ncbi:MAG: ester cyclase, partial [Rhodothermia bacterium]|nr:ester cyclase [Rhodothermia bacterium]